MVTGNTVVIVEVSLIVVWWLFCIAMIIKKEDWNWFLLALVGVVPIGLLGHLVDIYL